MQRSDFYRENGQNCLRLAETAKSEPDRQRFTRMAAAWAALTVEQEWLDGQIVGGKTRDLTLMT